MYVKRIGGHKPNSRTTCKYLPPQLPLVNALTLPCSFFDTAKQNIQPKQNKMKKTFQLFRFEFSSNPTREQFYFPKLFIFSFCHSNIRRLFNILQNHFKATLDQTVRSVIWLPSTTSKEGHLTCSICLSLHEFIFLKRTFSISYPID